MRETVFIRIKKIRNTAGNPVICEAKRMSATQASVSSRAEIFAFTILRM